MKNGSEKYIEAVKYLGELYDFLNRRFFADELEKPVITICPDGKNKALGWFVCDEVWREDGEEKGATHEGRNSRKQEKRRFHTIPTERTN